MDTKKLRQKILDLAIHGKLVPQDPNDEPASVLLERIRAEKEALIKEGKIKRAKKTTASDTSHYENVPFEVPEGWCWIRLKDIASFGGGKTPSMENKEYWDNGTHLWVTSKDMKTSLINDSMMKISDEALKTMQVYQPGTLLMVTRSGILRRMLPLAILGEKATVNQDLKTISIVAPILPIYVFYAILANESMILKDYHKDGTTVDSINFDKFIEMPIPLPPMSEQKRITDTIENYLSLVEEINVSEDDILTCIDFAKSKILDLAIHGKLVPQDPTDEPASELLKRINHNAVISCDNPHYAEPYELPHGWVWIELGKLAVDSADGPFGSNLKKEHYTMNKEVRIIQLSNIGEDGWKDENTKYTTFEHLSEVSRSEVKSGDVVIAKMMPAGRAILCPNSDVKYVLSSDAVKFVLPEGICNEYILNSINSSVFREQVYDNVQGVTRVRTSLQKLRSYVLPIPPYNEQLRIVSKVNDIFSKLDMIEKSLQA